MLAFVHFPLSLSRTPIWETLVVKCGPVEGSSDVCVAVGVLQGIPVKD